MRRGEELLVQKPRRMQQDYIESDMMRLEATGMIILTASRFAGVEGRDHDVGRLLST